MILTLYNFIDREKTLKIISNTLKKLDAPQNLIDFTLRKNNLIPTPPPGRKNIVVSRSN